MVNYYRCLNCMAPKAQPGICASCNTDDKKLQKTLNAMQPGLVLQNRYLIGKLLGSGGFGNTYLAFNLNLDRKCAIKEYMPYGIASRRIEEQEVTLVDETTASQYRVGMDKFLEEAKTLSRFNDHPGIVSIIDFFHENNTAYIVMEYIDGITLKEYLQRKGGKLSLEQTLEIIAPVLDALREVHGAGILHRDISPENIYITATRQVKLLDFGAARHAMGEASKSLSVILKPGYAPEEQYRSRGKQGPWTDIYAVAATIYHCVTGVLPPDSLDRFDEDTLVPLSKIVASIPADIEKGIMTALAVRGRDRFQTVEAFQRALHIQADGESVSQAVKQHVAKPTPLKLDVSVSANADEKDSVDTTPPISRKPGIRIKWNRWTIGSGVAVLSVLLLYLGWFILMDKSHGDYVGLPIEQVKQELLDRGVPENKLLIEYVFNQEQADSVVAQQPKAGTAFHANGRVELKVGRDELEIGEYVQFGKYNKAPILWRVIHNDKDGDPMLFSDKIISIKAFDARGEYHSNSNRESWGSNFYEKSNLRQWLNSDEQKIDWWQNRPTKENTWGDNPYDQEKGFLASDHFTAAERSYIKPRTHKVLLAEIDSNQADGGNNVHQYDSNITKVVQNYDSAWYENVTDQVFLLSVKDLKEYVYDHRLTFGENWWIGEPTAEAVANSTYENDGLKVGKKWYYWLNTPNVEYGSVVRFVYDAGGVHYGNHARGDDVGVRPALQLNLQSAIFTSDGAGTEKNPYTVQVQ